MRRHEAESIRQPGSAEPQERIIESDLEVMVLDLNDETGCDELPQFPGGSCNGMEPTTLCHRRAQPRQRLRNRIPEASEPSSVGPPSNCNSTKDLIAVPSDPDVRAGGWRPTEQLDGFR